ncbi:MAG: methanol/ethanol family PQQ-dependent dehydrogenase [Pseudomonadota bacterium]|nr:methanol/ethanol family PQQ-dependent dehydrogenase [Pseudomonadota bacterium]
MLGCMVLAAGGSALGNPALEKLSHDPANWVMWGGNFYGQRYSPLDQINNQNVSRLRPVWSFSTGVLRGHEGSPLVVGDTLYVHTPFPNKVFAINLDDQSIKWMYAPTQALKVISVMCCDTVNRGLAYAPASSATGGKNLVILQQADTELVALNADNGRVIWRIQNGDVSQGETNTNAPLVVKDKVITGISGGELGVRGFLSAYRLQDGTLVWKAYSTGPDDELLFDPNKTINAATGKPVGKNSSLKTWKGDQWMIGGGATWGWYTYDPKLDLIYYGSSNPGTWNPSLRPGDNKWSASIFVRDPDTGMAKWVFQMTPHDECDSDGVNEKILADLNIKGKAVPAVVDFDRNGFAYTWNRKTGRLLVAQKYDPATNWATKIDMKTGRPVLAAKYTTKASGQNTDIQNICPGAIGSKDEQPAAYSPKTGLFYVPTNHVCMDYAAQKVNYIAGHPYVGATLSMYPAPNVIINPVNPQEAKQPRLGTFIAWDATTGKIKWSIAEPFSVWSGALATAGDVVFYGTLEGYLKAVDAKTGKELYRFKTPSGIIGNVNTWSHDGKQYVGVLSGIGGWPGIGMAAGLERDIEGLDTLDAHKSLSNYTQLGGVLTVFALP